MDGRAKMAPKARVLVKATNWLGDVVMSQPALRALRDAFPEAHLAVLIRRELAPLLDGCGWIDEIVPYALGKGLRGVADRRSAIAMIRRGRYDACVLFPNSFDSALWPLIARVPTRAGYDRDARGLMLTHRLRPSREILQSHQSWYYLHMLRELLGVPMPPPAVRRELPKAAKLLPSGEWGDGAVEMPTVALPLAEKALSAMREFLRQHRKQPGGPLIAFAPGAAFGPAKQWPADRYAALAGMLRDAMGAEVVIVGAPSETVVADRVARASPCACIQAAGRTSVGELAALLSLCDGFAGNDSGSMHVAGALGVPTVGVFGSTRCDRTAPLGPRVALLYRKIECSPCMKKTCRFGHYRCLEQIGPEEVLETLRTLMASRSERVRGEGGQR